VLVKQQKLLKMDNVQLEFKQDALKAIAQEAYRRKTGARALRGIIELMLDVMYELPSQGCGSLYSDAGDGGEALNSRTDRASILTT